MSYEHLSSKQVNRLYLIKHHLIQKAKKKDLVRVVGGVCGLHAQAATTPYLSLWNRVADFSGSLLDEALYRSKSLVKTWVMRGTLHIIPSADLPVYSRALKRMWFEHHGRFMRAPGWLSIEERRNKIYPAIMEALAQKPLKRKDLSDKVRSLVNTHSRALERLFSGWGGILKEMAYEYLTVCAEPCEREACFARLDKWLPNVDLSKMSEEEAQKQLLFKYLRGYGPATQQDFALWSGLMAGDAKKAIENAAQLLTQVEIEGVDKPLLSLKEDLKALRSIDLDEHVPPYLLPRFDSILLGHKNRARIIRDEYKNRVFKPRAGDIVATVWVDGQIVGAWKTKKTKRALTIVIAPFMNIAKENLKEMERVAKDLGQFMGFQQTRLMITP